MSDSRAPGRARPITDFESNSGPGSGSESGFTEVTSQVDVIPGLTATWSSNAVRVKLRPPGRGGCHVQPELEEPDSSHRPRHQRRGAGATNPSHCGWQVAMVANSMYAKSALQASMMLLIIWTLHKIGFIDAEVGVSEFDSSDPPIGIHYPHGVSIFFFLPEITGLKKDANLESSVLLIMIYAIIHAAKWIKFISISAASALFTLVGIIGLYVINALKISSGVRKNVGWQKLSGDYSPRGLTISLSPMNINWPVVVLLSILVAGMHCTKSLKFEGFKSESRRKYLVLCVIVGILFYIFLQLSAVEMRLSGNRLLWRHTELFQIQPTIKLQELIAWNQILKVRENHICIAPSLDPRMMHVVVATGDGRQSLVEVQWLNKLGLSNATAFIYRRTTAGLGNISGVLKGTSVLQWPCGLLLEERLVAPNRGQEAAAYLAHIVEFYDNLPEAILFTHGHGPKGWHVDTANFIRRARAYYRGLVGRETNKSQIEIDSELHNNASLWSKANRRTPSTVGPGDLEPFREQGRHVAENHDLQSLVRFSRYQASLSTCDNRLCGGSCMQPTSTPKPQRDKPSARRLLDWTEVSPYVEPARMGPGQTFGVFDEIYARQGNHSYLPWNTDLWSCCATFVVRPWHIRRHPKALYSELLHALLQTDLPSYYSSRWFEFSWYKIFSGAELPID
jgi:hypothetical protein